MGDTRHCYRTPLHLSGFMRPPPFRTKVHGLLKQKKLGQKMEERGKGLSIGCFIWDTWGGGGLDIPVLDLYSFMQA